jgi:polysaccharide export outer membrane protein
MKTYKVGVVAIVLVLMVVVSAGAAEKATPSSGQDYVIGPGDVLEISVWKEEALTKQLMVLPDGKIAFPLIGEAMAGGWTVSQLKKEIEKRLSRFVPDPVLSVSVAQMNSLMIYVVGKVRNPNRFLLTSNINVLQALALAGGLNEFAERDEIRVFREIDGKTTIFNFNYDDVEVGKKLEQNITLKRGDVIVVP